MTMGIVEVASLAERVTLGPAVTMTVDDFLLRHGSSPVGILRLLHFLDLPQPFSLEQKVTEETEVIFKPISVLSHASC